MASLSVLTLKEGVIPLIPSFKEEDLRTIKVEHKFCDTHGEDVYKKIYLPVAPDSSNKEIMCYVLDQFQDASHSDRLNLDGVQLYSKFRSVLGGDLKMAFQSISERRTTAADKTAANFLADVQTMFANIMAPTAFEDQLEYIRSVTKPFNMTCEELGARLRIINVLSRFLTGNNGRAALFETETLLKRAYFRMMPSAWKVEFAKGGRNLDEATFLLVDLIRYMSVQELISKQGRSSNDGSLNRKRRDRDGNGGRGHGRGGGRGYQGRGRGRSNSGGYIPRYSSGSYQGYRGNSYGSGSYGGNGGGGYSAGYGAGFRSPPSAGGIPVTPGTSFRSPGRGNSGGRGGSYSGGSSGRSPYNRQGSRFASGRGGTPPYIPNFHAEHYMADASSRDYHHEHDNFVADNEHYAHEEHYYEEPASPEEQHYQDQFYQQQEEHDQFYSHERDEAYHQETAQEQAPTDSRSPDAPQDAHWLDQYL